MVSDSFQKKSSIAVAILGMVKAREKEEGSQCVGVVLVRKWYGWVVIAEVPIL